MKRLLTFTLSQSKDGKWKFYTFNIPYLLSLGRKLIFLKTKEISLSVSVPEERSRPTLSRKENTQSVLFVREFVIMAGELIISFI